MTQAMTHKKIPELLAPVGGWQHLKAAVQNGADAVYLGGPLFNARMKAENFTGEDVAQAADYAHARGVKVYITLNTLIKDSELFKALSYVNDLYGAGADAVILQDLGLARLVRKYLPDMPMHLSTQGTVYNKWAVDLVKAFGFCRVVPARELTLSELSAFAAECHTGKTPCEVEVFVHGALCMCYSGQCQMSRLLGGVNGRSGNRGLCAQPCRLPYEDDAGKKSFLLSPKDICTLEEIPRLCEAGIDSFKIEGRLKSPQYVAVVTSIYRKYLDQYRQTGAVTVHPEDMQRLAQIFNRGGFSKGYLFGNPGEKLLSGRSPKNQGIYVGKVKAVRKGSTLIDVETSELSMGDGIEIHGKKITGNVISYLKKLPAGCLRIGDIKEKVRPGDAVYKVTDKALLVSAEKTYENDFRRKVPVSMHFTAKLGELPELSVGEGLEQCGKGQSDTVRIVGTVSAQKSISRPLEEDRIRKQLGKLGDTVFEAKTIEIDMEKGLSIPVSVLNTMRREGTEQLLQQKWHHGRKTLTKETLAEIERSEALGKEIGRRCAPYAYIPLELFMQDAALPEEQCGMDAQEVIPYILNISKGRLDRYIEENFRQICGKVKDTGILIGNLGWIRQFQKAGVKVYGDYGLNVYNRQCEKAFEEMGVEIKVYSHELEEENTQDVPMMITEHPMASGRLKDRKGKVYTVVQNCLGDKSLIFAKTCQAGKEKRLLIRK